MAEDNAEADGNAEPLPEDPGAAETPEAEAGTRIGKGTVFGLCMVFVLVLVALACFAISLPSCENPPNSWAPCIGP